MKKFSKEVQIALVAIVGIVILYMGLHFLKGLPIFSTDRNYYVKFNDISGLSVSSPIYANGYRVGVVEDIIYDYGRQNNIVAVIGLNNEMRLPVIPLVAVSSRESWAWLPVWCLRFKPCFQSLILS